jgi:hypothetical protein
MHVKKHQVVALKCGAIFGAFHLGWLLLIALGLAKPMMDFVLDLHAIEFDYSIADLDIMKALLLIVMTFVVGYVLGYLLSMIFHGHKK